MTITDDERREVAAKMRKNADDDEIFVSSIVADEIGTDSLKDAECWNRLADLIEPAPTSSDRGPTCDRDALLELADRVQLIHSDPSRMGREACDYYGIGGDLDCEGCEAYTSDLKCLDLAIADVSRRIRAIANGLEGGSDAPAAGDEGHGGTDAHYDDCDDVEGHHIIDFSDKFNENIAAIDWVREQGGLDAVKARLMPEGMEWPRFEDGEPVRPGDKLLDKDGDWFEAVLFGFTCDWWGIRGYQTEGFGDLNNKTRRKLEGMAYGMCVNRPAPKVLDADGVEISVGDVLYSIETGDSVTVDSIEPGNPWFATTDGTLQHCAKFTHRAPVLAADGKPLREGETVWKKDGSYSFAILKIDGNIITMEDGLVINACYLTHERPDSWELLEEDAKLGRCDYNKSHGYPACCIGCDGLPLSDSCSEIMARDLVRRCRVLAERERGER